MNDHVLRATCYVRTCDVRTCERAMCGRANVRCADVRTYDVRTWGNTEHRSDYLTTAVQTSWRPVWKLAHAATWSRDTVKARSMGQNRPIADSRRSSLPSRASDQSSAAWRDPRGRAKKSRSLPGGQAGADPLVTFRHRPSPTVQVTTLPSCPATTDPIADRAVGRATPPAPCRATNLQPMYRAASGLDG